jgi:YesN/AraC family two-component response regulator
LMRINRVSELVGYQSPKYFAVAFKKLMGVTPQEWRDHKANMSI